MGLLLLQGASDLNPRELFANGEQGLWLDPSRLSTVYQDSNGVTPCTAAGDPVGLVLDQSRGGLANLGPEIVTNGGLSNATGWTVSGASPPSITGGQAVWSGSTGEIQWAPSLTVGKWYKLEFDLVSYTSGNLAFRDGTTNTSIATAGAVAGRKTFLINATSTQIRFISFASATVTIDNISVREVPGNHAYQSTSGQRPTLQTSGGLWYLSFDGTDDSLVTNSVDFTATNQMTVIAGVRKLSDAARGTVCELTATIASNNGAFHLTAPNAASATYAFESKGTLLTDGVASSVTAPLTSVISGSADISADTNVIRVNGTQSDSDTGDQGTGNYSNAALYIGRRGGTTLPFNGHLYQLIVRGKTTSGSKLLEAERFVARKTGVTF